MITKTVRITPKKKPRKSLEKMLKAIEPFAQKKRMVRSQSNRTWKTDANVNGV